MLILVVLGAVYLFGGNTSTCHYKNSIYFSITKYLNIQKQRKLLFNDDFIDNICLNCFVSPWFGHSKGPKMFREESTVRGITTRGRSCIIPPIF